MSPKNSTKGKLTTARTIPTIVTPSSGNITQGDIDKKGVEVMNEMQKKIDNAVDKFDNRISEREARTTEILAIFITLFTFISVNVSVFTKTTDLLSAVVFMVLMTLCSIVLVSFLIIISSKKQPNRLTSWGLVLSILCLSLLILIAAVTKWNPALNVK